MAKSAARKPLPALAFLLALSLLTALVWWRVLHRANDSPKSSASPSCSASTPAAVPVVSVPVPAAVTVKVLNSTTRAGLAASVGAALTTLGFKVSSVANDLTTRAPVTGGAEVRYGPLGKSAATLVSFYVPGSTLFLDNRTDASVDLSLGAKYTALAAAPAVAAALAAAHLTQSANSAPATAKVTSPKSAATVASSKSAATVASSNSAANATTAPPSC